MTLIASSRPRLPSARSLAARAARTGGAVVAALVRAVAREVDRRRTQALLGYDDALLRDIGITRADVYGALLTDAAEKPSAFLSRRRAEARDGERGQASEARRAARL